MLLERPGETVTREELRNRLWTADTFVDFDQGVNKAVNRIRDALGDLATSPRFVETVARRGYRFIADVSAVESARVAKADARSVDVAAPGDEPICCSRGAAVARPLASMVSMAQLGGMSLAPARNDSDFVDALELGTIDRWLR